MIAEEQPKLQGSRNNATKTRGKPFPPGNAGRPPGARNKTTLAIEALLEGQHVALTQKVVALALEGDGTALKLCFERLAPPRRDAPIKVSLPQVRAAGETISASKAVVNAVCSGEITPSEGGAVMALLSAHLRFVETLELTTRVEQLEALAVAQK
jgi:hypothetical protein